jgi:hypothetical protein
VVLKNLLTIRNVDGAYLDAMSGTTLQKKEITYKLELNFGVKGKLLSDEEKQSNNY